MGYNIYITRQVNWYDEGIANQITFAEWKNYIENDPVPCRVSFKVFVLAMNSALNNKR